MSVPGAGRVVLTREWGSVPGYDHDEIPEPGMIRAHWLAMTVVINGTDIVNSNTDAIATAAEKAWRQAVLHPRLPDGWAILRMSGEPDYKVLPPGPADDPLDVRVSLRVTAVWIARYRGR